MNTLRLILLSPFGGILVRWTALLALAWVANAAMRHSHPRRRLIMWRGVFVLGCLLPFGGLVPLKVFRLGGDASLSTTLAQRNSSARSAVDSLSVVAPGSKSTLPEPEGILSMKSGALLAEFIWLGGAAAGAIRLLFLQRRLSRLRRKAGRSSSSLLVLADDIRDRLGLRRTVVVCVSGEINSPLVCGLRRPTIMIPETLLRTLGSSQLSALLRHEMAHVRSLDLIWCVGWRWMSALIWIHPLIWRVPAAHNLACEQEADRIASDGWADRSLYSRLLAQLTLQVMELPPVETTLALSGASQIVKRLALLRRDGIRSWKGRDSLAAIALIAGLALVSAGWGLSTARAATPADETAQRLAEQRQPRTVVPLDPKQFDKYVGSYQLAPRVFFTITREGEHFFSQLTGQSKFEIFPESPTKFFYTVVAAQISFVTDADGNPVELVLHQNGLEQHALRVDESVAKDTTPDAAREPPLRRYAEALAKGQPDFDDMAPGLIAATKDQWPKIKKSTEGLGALKSLEFASAGSMGSDAYIGTFENGQMKFFVGPLDADHKMQGLFMIPWSAVLEERVKKNSPDPDREPPLRRYAEALAKGKADLDDMNSELGAATTSQWPQIQKMTEGLGSLRSLAFKNVDPMGWDAYTGTFEKGKLTFLVGPLNDDRKMQGLYIMP